MQRGFRHEFNGWGDGFRTFEACLKLHKLSKPVDKQNVQFGRIYHKRQGMENGHNDAHDLWTDFPDPERWFEIHCPATPGAYIEFRCDLITVEGNTIPLAFKRVDPAQTKGKDEHSRGVFYHENDPLQDHWAIVHIIPK